MNSKFAVAVFSFLSVLSGQLLIASNSTEQAPITMNQLLDELRVQGGNFKFLFDHPVFARVTTDVTPGKGSSEPQVEHFDSSSAQKQFDLFFSASPMFLGQLPTMAEDCKMMVKLSGCHATEGTRIIYYRAGLHGDGVCRYQPAVPAIPKTGEQYVLHWYFKEGVDYHAKAVIEFSDTPFR